MLYIAPDECIDCEACVPECPVEAIFHDSDSRSKATTDIRIPDGAAAAADQKTPVGISTGAGYGDPEKNKLVERAAIAAVKAHYELYGWDVKSVEREKRGFDFICKKGEIEENVEVKGIGGDIESFPITAGEVEQARMNPRFVLVVVTQALSRAPATIRYAAEQFLSSFSLDVVQYRARKIIQPVSDADGLDDGPFTQA